MDINLVYETFLLYSEVSQQEGEKWLPLCHWAVASLYGRLRLDADVVENRYLLCFVAGVMAYYKYVLRNAAKEGSAVFAAGDVKVTEHTEEKVKAAKQLYEDAMESIAHLLEDKFAFVGVPA